MKLEKTVTLVVFGCATRRMKCFSIYLKDSPLPFVTNQKGCFPVLSVLWSPNAPSTVWKEPHAIHLVQRGGNLGFRGRTETEIIPSPRSLRIYCLIVHINTACNLQKLNFPVRGKLD